MAACGGAANGPANRLPDSWSVDATAGVVMLGEASAAQTDFVHGAVYNRSSTMAGITRALAFLGVEDDVHIGVGCQRLVH